MTRGVKFTLCPSILQKWMIGPTNFQSFLSSIITNEGRARSKHVKILFRIFDVPYQISFAIIVKRTLIAIHTHSICSKTMSFALQRLLTSSTHCAHNMVQLLLSLSWSLFANLISVTNLISERSDCNNENYSPDYYSLLHPCWIGVDTCSFPVFQGSLSKVVW